MKRIVPIVLLLAAACQRPVADAIPEAPQPQLVGPVLMTAGTSSYAPGATVTLAIANHTQEAFGFHPCTRTLERHTGGQSWEQQAEPPRMCTRELWTLEPRMTRSASTELPAGLQAGTYRLTIAFSRQNTTSAGAATVIRASTQPFTVR